MSVPKIYGFIPARMASSRFYGKPLYPIAGIPMIEHVIKRAQMYGNWSELYLTTCDEEIRTYCETLNISVVMTSNKHKRALDRIAEAAKNCKHEIQENDIILNVQGDEPMLLPDMIEATINPMIEDKNISGTVLAMHIIHEDQYRDPNALKIIHDIKGNIIYTSRSPVPHCKKFTPELGARRIFGIFGFRWHFLKMFNELPESPLELSEECDSNRFYDHGYTQRIAPYDFVESFSVDVPDDINKVEKFLSKDEIFKKYK